LQFYVVDLGELHLEDRIVHDFPPMNSGATIGRNRQIPSVEGAIYEGRQADAVAGVEAEIFVLTPRDDVRGNQELSRFDARDSALPAVIALHGLREDGLSAASHFRVAALILDSE